MNAALRECRWCTKTHGDLLLCQPARDILNALYARGMEGNMPSIEFPEPVHGLLGDDLVLMTQAVVKGALLPFSGVTRPLLIITGRDGAGKTLPQWATGGSADDVRRFIALVSEQGEMAIRRASEAT